MNPSTLHADPLPDAAGKALPPSRDHSPPTRLPPLRFILVVTSLIGELIDRGDGRLDRRRTDRLGRDRDGRHKRDRHDHHRWRDRGLGRAGGHGQEEEGGED